MAVSGQRFVGCWTSEEVHHLAAQAAEDCAHRPQLVVLAAG